MIELVGYLASALVVASLAMTSVVRLRAISLVGSVVFVVYGVLIGSVPIIITNAAIAALNVWFLRAELTGKRSLGAVPVSVGDPFLTDFVEYHLHDIHRFQPEFDPGSLHADDIAVLLMRDGLPAGALIGRRHGSELHVALDYVTKPFRDSRIGTWLYGSSSGVFDGLGVQTVVTTPGTDLHVVYLVRLGFVRRGAVFKRVVG